MWIPILWNHKVLPCFRRSHSRHNFGKDQLWTATHISRDREFEHASLKEKPFNAWNSDCLVWSNFFISAAIILKLTELEFYLLDVCCCCSRQVTWKDSTSGCSCVHFHPIHCLLFVVGFPYFFWLVFISYKHFVTAFDRMRKLSVTSWPIKNEDEEDNWKMRPTWSSKFAPEVDKRTEKHVQATKILVLFGRIFSKDSIKWQIVTMGSVWKIVGHDDTNELSNCNFLEWPIKCRHRATHLIDF